MRRLPFADHSFDFAICQLALHHLSDADAITALRELRRVARFGVWVTDLQRSQAGLLGTWLLTRVWLRHPMTRRDAVMSFRAAFHQSELLEMARVAGWKSTGCAKLPWFRQAIWCKDKECPSSDTTSL